MPLFEVPGYYDTYNPDTKSWVKVLFNPSVPLQSQELNSLQSIATEQLSTLANVSLNEGQYISGGTITVQSNSNADETLTVGGSVTTANVLTLTITDSGLTGGSLPLAYTVQAGDTLTTIATAITALINDNVQTQDLFISATSAGPVITITSLSPNTTTYSTSTSSGATETLTLATGAQQLKVSIDAGTVWASGYFHNVPAGYVEITGTGTEYISLVINDDIITSTQDSDLLDPALDTEDYAQAGADRLAFTYDYVYGANGVLVATFTNGQILNNSITASANDYVTVPNLAQQTYETSGGFLATLPNLTMTDTMAADQNPAQMDLEIDGGVGYSQGYRVSNTKIHLPVARTMDGVQRTAEPHVYSTGTAIYTIDNPTVLQMTTVLSIIQSPSFAMTRGSVVNGQDAIPDEYQPVSSIVSVSNVGHGTFTQGTDYTLAGNYIQWQAGGSQPAAGSTYNVVVQYSIDLTEAQWTQTQVTNESHASGSTVTLSNTNIQSISTINGTAYVEGTNYTLNHHTGVLTNINIPAGTWLITYTYWYITLAGDFTARDSFIDSSGNQIFYGIPTWDAAGTTIDYTKQVSFATGGRTPVNSTNVFYTYNYALSRIDVLGWQSNGLLQILKGVPAVNPSAPTPATNMLPVAKMILPPESFASDVTYQYYNNLTMYVTDLRAMQANVSTVQYNLGNLQLVLNAANITTNGEQQGIFADPFTNTDYADLSSTSFSGTFDFTARTFAMGRTAQTVTPTLTSTTANLQEDMWMTNSTNVIDVSQPYASNAMNINCCGNIATPGKITLNPATISSVSSSPWTLQTAASVTIVDKTKVKNAKLITYVNASSPLTKVASSNTSSISIPAVVQKVPVPTEWGTVLTDSTVTTKVTQNWLQKIFGWETITTNMQVSVATQPTAPGTVAITGTGFEPNCVISGYFNRAPIQLDGSATITADSSGNFTTSIVIPATTASGSYAVELIGEDPTSHLPVSDASATLTYDTAPTAVESAITLTAFPIPRHRSIRIVIRLCHGLHPTLFPSAAVIAAIGDNDTRKGPKANNVTSTLTSTASVGCGDLATLLSLAVQLALQNSISLTTELVLSALTGALEEAQCLTLFTTEQLQGMVDALDLTNPNPTGNAAAVAAAQPAAAAVSIGVQGAPEVDPLAQIFTPNNSENITGVDLFFKVAPALATTPVTLTFVSVDPTTLAPSTSVLATVVLPGSAINVSTDGSVATNFPFSKSVFVTAGAQYAVVVSTEDENVQIWTAVSGNKDVVTGNLVSTTSAIGSMLQSQGNTDWSITSGTVLKFNVYRAAFTTNQSVLSMGAQTFSPGIASFSINAIEAEPSSDCTVVYQYSLDGSEWTSIPPLIEYDLSSAATTVYFQILLNGTTYLSPTITNSVEINAYSYNSPGCYIHNAFTLNSADGRYADLYVYAALPGGTTITPYVAGNGGSWEAMTLTGTPVNIDNTFYEYHYTYDFGSESIQTYQTKTVLTSSSSAVTPQLRNYRVIASV